MSATHTHDRRRANQQPPPLELWQTEWCPASQRVRQRLTELGLAFLARPVPVDPDARTELWASTGQRSIPVLIADAEVISGEDAIRDYLDSRFPEPSDARSQREKAAGVKRKELERTCPELASATY
jgi:glutathione S-transferase